MYAHEVRINEGSITCRRIDVRFRETLTLGRCVRATSAVSNPRRRGFGEAAGRKTTMGYSHGFISDRANRESRHRVERPGFDPDER